MYTLFELVYGREAIFLAEFIVSNLFISHTNRISEDESPPDWVNELLQMDESLFLAYFHQTVEKEHQKAWHDHHIKKKSFSIGDQVLLYDSKYKKHPGKLQMHWLSSFYVADIEDSGALRLAQLDGTLFSRWVNGAHLKPYFYGSTSN